MIGNNLQPKLRTVLYIAFLAIMAVFIWSRVEMVPLHFTHYDDLYAPYLFTVIGGYDPVFFSSQVEKYGGFIGAALAPIVLDFFSNNPSIFAFFKSLLTPISIAKTSTFAPLQFYLTALTADFDTSYTMSKISFRLPSAIFSLLSVLMLYQFSKKMEKDEAWHVFVAGSAILSVSWMFLIYSSQGENFAAGVFSLITILYLYKRYQFSSISTVSSIKVGLVLSLLCLLHYQTIFFLPSLFAALFYESNFSIRVFVRKWLGSITVVGSTILAIYFVFLRERLKSNPGVHWNAGEDGQYAFSADCGEGFLGCAVQVFSNNFFEVFQSIVSFSNLDGSTSVFYSIILIALTLLGLFYVAKTKQNRGLLVFVVVGALVWVFLVLIGKLTFSPTRHSLILLPIVAILSSLGLFFITSLLGKSARSVYMVFMFSIVVLALYVSEFGEQKHERMDPLEEVDIYSVISEYNPDSIIAYSHAMHLALSPQMKEEYDTQYTNAYPYYTSYSKKASAKKDRVLILCVSGILCGSSDSKPVATLLTQYYGSKVEYQRIFAYEKSSKVLNGFGSRAGIGSNGLYISVWDANEQR